MPGRGGSIVPTALSWDAARGLTLFDSPQDLLHGSLNQNPGHSLSLHIEGEWVFNTG